MLPDRTDRMTLRLLIAAFCLTPTLALAWGGGAGFSDVTTTRVAQALTQGVANCHNNLPWVYRYDCYRKTYADVVRDLRYNRDYEPARKILADVERTLGGTIGKYADPSAPPARQGLNSYNAIRKDALPAAKQEFVAALQEAETRLLRTPDQSAHFQRIAAALETNKVLLRSAALWLYERFATLTAPWG